MASEEKWYFTKDQLDNTPSRKCGFDAYKELFYRQQAANFIQDMGQRLRVTQLCINTATVYMHRFYVFHSFTHFPWHSIAAAALFLSAKVEEQPRKLEHVIRIHNICKNSRDTALDVQSERYQVQSQDLVFNENILLQTLGFDVAIDHPHAHVVRCCHLVRASKDLAQTSYFMASTSLHLTTMCLQYKPTVVACFCIHLACKWSNWEIPLSNEKKEWFSYVDPTVTAELLQQLTEEFLVIFERCPSRLKEKIMAIGDGNSMCRSQTQTASPFDSEPRKLHPPTDLKDPHHRLHHHEKANMEDPHKHRSRPPYESSSSSQQQREREYREKKERERMAQQQQQHSSSGKPPIPHPNASSAKPPSIPHGHHRPPVDPQMKPHSRPPSMGHPPHRPSDMIEKDSHASSKDLDKRGYPVKQSDGSVQQEHYSDKRLKPVVDAKVMHKQHESRHEQKSGYKSGSSENDARKHWFDPKNVYDKNNMHVKPQPKIKSPFTPDASISKSVPNKPIKTESHNGSSSSSSNGGYGLPLVEDLVKQEVKEEPPFHPPAVKKPSMFSPEKSPPRKPTSVKQRSIPAPDQNIPTPISPLESFGSSSGSKNRQRTGSSGSEPELRPVMKKIDQVEGFENILRDSTIGIKQEVPEQPAEQPVKTVESTPAGSSSNSVPLSQPIVNGIETNPTLISNLLKEAPSIPHLPAVAASVVPPAQVEEVPVAPAGTETKEKEHHHKDRKKKSKDKHKHKDKDKSRGDKEKKKKYKDKDKDKERHKSKNKDKEKPEEVPTPIKITISKDKIQQPTPDTPSVGLKIKIPKDRLKADVIGEVPPSSSSSASSAVAPPATPSPIKIKISKEVIMGSESKKRERDRGNVTEAPPPKIHKSSYSKQHHVSGDKQNGRSSFGKVAQLGDGDTSSHRLADSKYTNKGAPT